MNRQHEVKKVSVQVETKDFSFSDLSDYIYTETYEIQKEINLYNLQDVCILAIARGGLTLAHSLAHKLCIKDIFTTSIKSYDDKQKRELDVSNFVLPNSLSRYKIILVVDDINDSGDTLNFVVSELNKIVCTNTKVYTVALFEKAHSKHKLRFCPNRNVENNIWINFFWEF